MTSKWFCHHLPSFHWSKHAGWHGGNSSTSATQTPCELHSILCVNPCNWTFLNCNISFNGSVHKQNNKRVIVTSSVWENLSYFGSLAIRVAKNTHHSVGCTKTRTDYYLFSFTWRRQFSVENACVSLFPCVSSYRWIHFPRSVLSVFSTSPVAAHSFLRKSMLSFIFMKSHG